MSSRMLASSLVLLALAGTAPAVHAATYLCRVDVDTADDSGAIDTGNGETGPADAEAPSERADGRREAPGLVLRLPDAPVYEPASAWQADARGTPGALRVDVVLDVSQSLQPPPSWARSVEEALRVLFGARFDPDRIEIRLYLLAAAGDTAVDPDALVPDPIPASVGTLPTVLAQRLAAIPSRPRYTPLAATLDRLANTEERSRYLLVLTDGWDCTPAPPGSPDECVEANLPEAKEQPARRLDALQAEYAGGTSVWLHRRNSNAAVIEGLRADPAGWSRGDCDPWDSSCVSAKGAPTTFVQLRRRLPDRERGLSDPSEWSLPSDGDAWSASAGAIRSVPGGGVADLRPIEAERFDTVAALGRQGLWHCSGVLVGEGVVLTARHCLPVERVTFAARVEESATLHRVVAASEHPDPLVDAALLRLDGSPDVELDSLRGASDTAGPFGTVRAAGFGAVDRSGTRGDGRRHVTDLPAMGWGCSGPRAATLGCLSEWEMVLRSASRDTCNGDSGGPVFEPWVGSGQAAQAAGLDAGQRLCGWRLLAITSRPVATSRVACGDGGIYTRIDRLQPWLTQTIRTLEGT